MNIFKKFAFLFVGMTLVIAPVVKADDHAAKPEVAAAGGKVDTADKTLLAKPQANEKVAQDAKAIKEAGCEKCKNHKSHKDCKECKKAKCEKCGEDQKNCKCEEKSCEHCSHSKHHKHSENKEEHKH